MYNVDFKREIEKSLYLHPRKSSDGEFPTLFRKQNI
jgi:hypothetical protein